MKVPVELAVLVSGTGRSLQNLIDLIGRKELPARISVVVSSRPDAPALERARRVGLPTAVAARPISPAITRAIEPYRVDLIVLAGFYHLYRFPERYAGRVLNIHPALLPEFGGKGMFGPHVHEAVIASGAKESGCTVHLADHEYDHGPIVLQRRCPVLPGDTPETLAERVFREELIAYPEAIRMFADGRIGAARTGAM